MAAIFNVHKLGQSCGLVDTADRAQIQRVLHVFGRAEQSMVRGEYTSARDLWQQVVTMSEPESNASLSRPLTARALDVLHAMHTFGKLGLGTVLAKLEDPADRVINLTPTIESCVTYAMASPHYDKLEVADLKNLLGCELLRHRNVVSVVHLEHALQVRQSQLSRTDPRVLESVVNLARALLFAKKYAESQPLFERALQIAEAAFGSTSRDVASILHKLSLVLAIRGDWASFQLMIARAFLISTTDVGLGMTQPNMPYSIVIPVHVKLAYDLSVCESLPTPSYALSHVAAAIHHTRGLDPVFYALAQPVFERAVTAVEFAFGRDHPHMHQVLHDLTIVMYKQGDFAEAQRLMERALEICTETWGPGHTRVAECWHTLAYVMKLQGHLDAAQLFNENALAIREAEYAPHHPEVVTSLNNLALVLQDRGEFAKAKTLMKRVLSIDPTPDHQGIWTRLKTKVTCSVCGIKGVKLQLCSRCRNTYYCSTECQVCKLYVVADVGSYCDDGIQVGRIVSCGDGVLLFPSKSDCLVVTCAI